MGDFHDFSDVFTGESFVAFPAVNRDRVDADFLGKFVAVSVVLAKVFLQGHARSYHSGKFPASIYYQGGYLPPIRLGDSCAMNRIKEIRQSHKLTQAALGELLGTTGATIQRLENEKRGVSIKWLDKIATTLNIPVEDLLTKPAPNYSDGMPVKGEARAGIWRESENWDEDKYPPLPISPDPRYIALQQYALRVVGTSMNKVFSDGQYVVCVRWADVGRNIRTGDIVVVERRRDGLTENTLKRARISRGVLELVPESTDPKWQAPITLDVTGDTDDIAITGLVIGRYEQF